MSFHREYIETDKDSYVVDYSTFVLKHGTFVDVDVWSNRRWRVLEKRMGYSSVKEAREAILKIFYENKEQIEEENARSLHWD